jgi:hypothetical protein
MRFYLKRWFALVCLIMECVYAHLIVQFLALLFQGHSGLLVQGQGRSFEIGKDGGPTLFTKSFDCGALG